MISYEIYKILHLFFIVILFTTLALQVFSKEPSKKLKMWSGIASLLILISGMGLLARIGVPHAEPWANWIRVKLGVWMVLTIASPIIFKRFPHFVKTWWYISFILLLTALVAVQYKF